LIIEHVASLPTTTSRTLRCSFRQSATPRCEPNRSYPDPRGWRPATQVLWSAESCRL